MERPNLKNVSKGVMDYITTLERQRDDAIADMKKVSAPKGNFSVYNSDLSHTFLDIHNITLETKTLRVNLVNHHDGFAQVFFDGLSGHDAYIRPQASNLFTIVPIRR